MAANTSKLTGGQGHSDGRLRRSLNVWQLYFIIVSGIIGSGWLFASLGAAAGTGPSAIFSWIIASVLVTIIALAFSEMAGIIPRTGAAVRYPHFTHGSYVGAIIGWCFLLWALAVPSLEAEAVVTYASDYIPGLINNVSGANVLSFVGILFAIGLMIIFAIVNYFGVLVVGRIGMYATIWKMVIPCLTFLLLFFFNMHSKNFLGYGGMAPLGASSVVGTIVTSGIAFAIISPIQGLEYGGESRNPQRDLPLATIAGIVTAAIIYILLQTSFLGAIDWKAIGIPAGDWSKLATSSWSSAPFVKALQSSSVGFVGAFSIVLLIDAYISPSATGFVYLGIGTRTAYGLSSVGYLPDVFQRLNRARIPWVALLAAFIVGCFLFAPFPSWYAMVSVASSTIAIVLVVGGIGLTVLRRTAPDLRRVYRLPLSFILAPAATISAVLFIYWAGYSVLVTVVAAALIVLPAWSAIYAPSKGWMPRSTGIVLGAVFLVVWVLTQAWSGWILAPATKPIADHPPFALYWIVMAVEVGIFTLLCGLLSAPGGRKEVWRAIWLEFLILVILVLSFVGAYGPLKTAIIPFPWDSILACVLGLVVYFWGVSSGFLTEEVQLMNERGTGIVEEDATEDLSPSATE